MKLLVGLGNPGPRYAGTRHNVGFRIVERFADRHGLVLGEERFDGRFGWGRVRSSDSLDLDVGILEPLTFMNRSGNAVAGAMDVLPVGDSSENLIVCFDDVDLPFGRLRLRPAGGAGGHRGVEDIIACLGSERFGRLRFGVGRPSDAETTTDRVLRGFSDDEQARLDSLVNRAADALDIALWEGIAVAMNRFNREPVAEPDASG